MSELQELLKSINVPEEKLQKLVAALNIDPMAAFSIVPQLGISPEILQKIMAIVMANPNAIREIAQEFGISGAAINSIESQVKKMGPSDQGHGNGDQDG